MLIVSIDARIVSTNIVSSIVCTCVKSYSLFHSPVSPKDNNAGTSTKTMSQVVVVILALPTSAFR